MLNIFHQLYVIFMYLNSAYSEAQIHKSSLAQLVTHPTLVSAPTSSIPQCATFWQPLTVLAASLLVPISNFFCHAFFLFQYFQFLSSRREDLCFITIYVITIKKARTN